ncbi:MAG: tRNA (adenosine(37)-N6)-threonylcarbamoyltransferase complex transferase subunit TsaD [Verrucomicrobia bacterium]|nr:tRNA (adenosine(37)-N6)-threonylcarbamoyltransferase complex transferase subunit TsaD [Verrucomicrobiota bacterium]
MRTILAIETSCDETAVAVLRDRELLASEVASQIAEHEKFGGVVPEVAARNHLVQLPRMLGRAMTRAKVSISDIDAFAATGGPGLASSLLVGNSAAKALAIGAGKRFLAINHLEGHLLSPFFPEQRQRASQNQAIGGADRTNIEQAKQFGQDPSGAIIFPHVALIVSGGHTLLVLVRRMGEYQLLGRTVDDAAGEAFDKVAKLLGLSYPGGPEIERRARVGNPARFDLPRSMLESGDLNFSFSGLKTAVRYLLPIILNRADARAPHQPGADTPVIPSEVEESRSKTSKVTLLDSPTSLAFAPQDVGDLCASFQQAVIDVLREKSLRALRQTNTRCLTISGGVSCNQALRESLGETCRANDFELRVAPPWLCTDNAAMIAFAAMLRFESGLVSSLEDEIDPNLALTN